MPVSDDELQFAVTWPLRLPTAPRHIGVAVSGGSDSIALLHLLFGATKEQGVALSAATVNHGLRPEAEAEAQLVAEYCAARLIPHETLYWKDRTGRGNLSDEARSARYGLLADWALRNGVEQVALGHTRDDQAETFLMRLAREAGVDGLSGMRGSFTRHGIRWTRPLLTVGRADLQAYLVRQGIGWSSDPSNDDEDYERVRARHVVAALGPLGIDAAKLARVAFQLEDASIALRHAAVNFTRHAVTSDRGDITLDMDKAHGQSYEIARRILVGAIRWISGSHYAPRRDDLNRLMIHPGLNGRRTLTGCILTTKDGLTRITRELNAVRALTTPTTDIWDTRWRLDGPHDPSLEIRALGDIGIRLCPDWRATGMPRQSLLASPAVWQGDTLIAAPLAGKPNGWTARIITDFHASLLSH